MPKDYDFHGVEREAQNQQFDAEIVEKGIQQVADEPIKARLLELPYAKCKILDTALNLTGYTFYTLGQCKPGTKERILAKLTELIGEQGKEAQETIANGIAAEARADRG